MADRKISDLTAATSLDDALDVLVGVDVSDTTQAASGTTKKYPASVIARGLVNSIGSYLSAPALADAFMVGNSVDASNPYRVTFEGLLNRPSQTSAASNPGADRLQAYVEDTASRPLLSAIAGGVNRRYAYQPAIFANYFGVITPAVTTTVNVFGCAATSVGTLSHPTVTTATGYMTNFASAASANATAGTGFNQASFWRGDGSGPSAGFFFACRNYWPDASYDAAGASTGKRLFVGLTSGTLAASVASDNPTGDFCGFIRFNVNGGLTHSNWQFATKDGTTLNIVDTGLAFTPQNAYDCFIWCAPNGSTVEWRIDDITTGGTVSGNTTTNLPTNNVLLRPGIQVLTVNATATNVRMQRVYCETDL